MKNKIFIVAALKNEINPVISELAEYQNNELEFLVSGIGREKAINNLSVYTQNQKAKIIINIGSCGSLNEKFNIGDVIVPVAFSAEKSRDIIPENIFVDKFANNYKTGRFFSSDIPVMAKDHKSMIRQQFNADIVDMESYWIAQFCEENKIEFYSVKVVSDLAEGISIAEFKAQMNKIAGNLVEPVKKILELVEANG